MKQAITIRIDIEMKEQFEKLAKASERSTSFLVVDALQEYLAVNQWQIHAIEEGIKQADAGQLIPHEDIRKKWETKLANTMD